MHPSVAARLARLAPDQRAAAIADPGPVLCVAPAGSGKTTTLVARIAWLVDGGVGTDSIAAITFNKRAAEELSDRLDSALEPLGLEPGAVRVRTFHALGREILRDAGERVEPLLDRDAVLRTVLPAAGRAERRRLDTVISRLKLDLFVTAAEVAADPGAGPTASAFVAYERFLAGARGLDFDDLVARTIRRLESDAVLLDRWRARCAHLLVDEVQDLDRSQLRLALLLTAPANRIFLVGDDDQSIYGWRLADVRRLISLGAESLPGLRRVDLVTNYRCPRSVIERAVRLVRRNRERFEKAILPRRDADGSLVLAPSSADDVSRLGAVFGSGLWDRRAPGETYAVLARTNRELIPAVVCALEADLPFRAGVAVVLPIDSPHLDVILVAARASPPAPLPVTIARIRAQMRDQPGHQDATGSEVGGATDVDDDLTFDDVAAAILGWSIPFAHVGGLIEAVAEARARLARLRRDDASLTLATAHGTKGLEFDHVAVVGMDDTRFPSARAVAEAEEPGRALEEERRLAYVAWTRARRSLTLVYDPAAPSSFLLEAFSPEELGIEGDPARKG